MSKKTTPTPPKKIVNTPASVVVEKGFTPSIWKTQRNALFIFFVLTFAMYAYSIVFDYVLDDQIVISDNQFTKKGMAGIGDILKKETFVGYFGKQQDLVMGARYRPLSLVTFAMEWALFAPDEKTLPKLAAGAKRDYNEEAFATVRKAHHFNNIVLYFLSGVLLFSVLLLLFPVKEEENWFFNIPFVASLLFLLHPIHIEAVANIKGRDEILAFIAIFATLYYSIKYAQTDKIKYVIFGTTTYFLGLLSKENALTFLAIVPLTLYCFTESNRKKILIATLPLLAMTLFYLLLRKGIIGYLLSNGKEITDVMNNPFYGMTSEQRYSTVFYTLSLYIKLLFVPHPLSHDYYPYQIPVMTWGNWEAIASLSLYVSLGLYGVWSVLKRKSVVGFGILFYLITLSIVSNVPFSIGTFMNERFIYLSSVGFCIIVAYWLTKPIAKLNKILAIAIFALFSSGYLFKTFERVPVWRDTLSLNTSAIQVSPNSARANLFYGVALFQEAAKQSEPDRKETMYKAYPYLQKAIEILPSYGSAVHMISGVDAEIYQYDKDLDKILAKYAVYMKQREKLSIEDATLGYTFMDKYLAYFNGFSQNKDKMIAFYRSIIPIFLTEKKSKKDALRYINFGLVLAPNDTEFTTQAVQAQLLK